MKEKSSLKVILLITVATFFGKLLGLLRDVLISYYYGSSSTTDAFFLALSIPTILLGVFTASTDSAVIPQYIRVLGTSRKKADALFTKIVVLLSVICGIVCALIFLFPRVVVGIFATGFSEDTTEICIGFVKLFAPIGLLHMLYCFFCTYCAAYKENVVRTILAFSTNLIVVASLLVYHDDGMRMLALSYLFANILCAVLPMISSYRIGYRFQGGSSDGELRIFILQFLPIMGGACLNDIQQYVDKNIGSHFEGGISALNYASKVINIFDSILVVGIGVVLLPILSEAAKKKDMNEFKKSATEVTKWLLIILLPCLGVLLLLSGEIVSFLFERGKLSKDDVMVVTGVLKTYSPLIVLVPIQTIFSKFFHALEKNKTPFWINLGSVFLNIWLSILLCKVKGVEGISLATSISTFAAIIVYLIIISKLIGWDRNIMKFYTWATCVAALILSIVIGYYVKTLVEILVVRIIVVASIVFITYFGCYILFNKQDAIIVKKMIYNKLRKGKQK